MTGSKDSFYGKLDPSKISAQSAGKVTERHLERFGFKAVEWSRGESVYVVETPLGYVGLVIEGLGTKSLVADTVSVIESIDSSKKARSYYENIAYCNVAMALNDMITLGILPVVYGQYLAVNDGNWFDNKQRAADLVLGTLKACEDAQCVWGCGETPSLSGIIVPKTVDLAGGTWGIAERKHLINPANIAHGDVIVFISSSGIHANGLTNMRELASNIHDGYSTRLSDGRTLGETLLDPTRMYVRLVKECQDAGVPIHYAVNITGHGWCKLMRAQSNFAYVITELPPQLPIFEFIRKHFNTEFCYGKFNMGAGFALYVDPAYVPQIMQIALTWGLVATPAGYIERSAEKKVVIRPEGIEFGADFLAIR